VKLRALPDWLAPEVDRVLEHAAARPTELSRRMVDAGVTWPEAPDVITEGGRAMFRSCRRPFPRHATQVLPADDGGAPTVVLFTSHPIFLQARARLLLFSDWTPEWRKGMARISDVVGHELARIADRPPRSRQAKLHGIAWGRLWSSGWRGAETRSWQS